MHVFFNVIALQSKRVVLMAVFGTKMSAKGLRGCKIEKTETKKKNNASKSVLLLIFDTSKGLIPHKKSPTSDHFILKISHFQSFKKKKSAACFVKLPIKVSKTKEKIQNLVFMKRTEVD